MSEGQTIEYGIPIHPACLAFPLMDEEALAHLEEDIRENGLRVPLVMHNGTLIDGRNRLIACNRAGVTPRFEQWDGKGSLASYVWSMNEPRRHLTPSQKAAAAVLMLPIWEQEAAERQAEARRQQGSRGQEGGRGHTKPSTQKVESRVSNRNESTAAAQAAKETGANRQYVAEAKKLKEENPEEFERLRTGKTTISQVKRKRQEQGSGQAKRRQRHKHVLPHNPANNAQRRFRDRHYGYIDACVEACRKKDGPINIKEVAAITGLSAHNIENNSIEQYWALVPWLELTSPSPGMFMFKINRYLRAVCADRGPRPSADKKAIILAIYDLRREIDRRREEARARRAGGKWNPEIAHIVKLVELLDYVETELDQLTVSPN